MSTGQLHVPAIGPHNFAISSASVASPAAPARRGIYAAAERRMRRGKRFVIGGFLVTVVGILGYCLACFSASQNTPVGSFDTKAWLVTAALGIVGLGTLLWLVGSFLFLNGAMDSDPEGPDLHF